MLNKNLKALYKAVYIGSLISGCMFLSSCKKFITVDTPPTSISIDNVYSTDATATGVLTGLYTKISQTNNFSVVGANLTAMSYYPGLSADELTLNAAATSLTLKAYYQNALTVQNLGTTDFWTSIYAIIYQANAAVTGLDKASQLTPEVRRQLLGEAYFIRAFCYFYLVNLYGDVLLTTSTDYETNGLLARTDKKIIYQQIITDLKAAQSMLTINYVDASAIKSTAERVRPNKWAATAMLSKAYLYTDDFGNAENEATSVIENKALFDTVSLNNVFIKNSRETIWALQPVLGTTSQNTAEGRLFILPATGPSATANPVYLSSNLMSAFESTDKRKTNWVKTVIAAGKEYPHAYKYKIGSVNTPTNEYIMVLRLAEVYLIRAEARARQGKLTASDDLNVIRKRAGLPSTVAATPLALLEAVSHERQTELFTEWGNRWLDLKRTGKIDEVMTTVTGQKGGTWDPRWALYPVPRAEVERNLNVKQNPGYE